MKAGRRPLTLAQLLQIAERGYRRGGLTLANYVNLRTGAFLRNPPIGDTLAEFVAIELAETFDPGTDKLGQLNEAVSVMGRASEDLHLITDALIHARTAPTPASVSLAANAPGIHGSPTPPNPLRGYRRGLHH